MTPEDKIQVLRKALEFYANPSDYKAPITDSKLYYDCGTVAQEALRATESAKTKQPEAGEVCDGIPALRKCPNGNFTCEVQGCVKRRLVAIQALIDNNIIKVKE